MALPFSIALIPFSISSGVTLSIGVEELREVDIDKGEEPYTTNRPVRDDNCAPGIFDKDFRFQNVRGLVGLTLLFETVVLTKPKTMLYSSSSKPSASTVPRNCKFPSPAISASTSMPPLVRYLALTPVLIL